jgi:hypothetical protein
MLILTQSRDAVVVLNSCGPIIISRNASSGGYSIYTSTGVELGVYRSEERAKDILKGIIRSEIFYEMPREEETK